VAVNRWVVKLDHHAAIIATFLGKTELSKRYYQESLALSPENPVALYGFVRGNGFSAAVMIGAAAEKCILLLADFLKPALSSATKQTRLQNLIEAERSLKKLVDFVLG
jgi:hypothetical protein